MIALLSTRLSHTISSLAGLNTCIGEANYKAFFRTMIYIFALEVSHFTIQLAMILDIFFDGGTKRRADAWFSANASKAINVILIMFLAFNAVSIFMIGQLLWFHINLQRDHLTTYQFIVQDHQRRRERAHLEEILEGKRAMALAKARQENQPMYVLELTIGGSCRKMGCPAFDPLPMPQPEPEPDVEHDGFGAALGRIEPAPLESSKTEKHKHKHRHHHHHHSKKDHSENSQKQEGESITTEDQQASPTSSSRRKKSHKRSNSASSQEMLKTVERPTVARAHSSASGKKLEELRRNPPQRVPSGTSLVTIDTNQVVLPKPEYYSAADPDAEQTVEMQKISEHLARSSHSEQ
jgi:DHHC palmitoyltransferase